MDDNLKADLFKIKRDDYRQRLFIMASRYEKKYSDRLEKALSKLGDNFTDAQISEVSQYTDNVAQAAFEYTFRSFADLLAEIDIEAEEKGDRKAL